MTDTEYRALSVIRAFGLGKQSRREVIFAASGYELGDGATWEEVEDLAALVECMAKTIEEGA